MFKETKASELLIHKPGLYLVKVDSDVARDWLRLNVKNRRIRKTLVAYLRRQIETNEWQFNHPQPIVFSDAGRLIDGQHRLTAIAEAEIYNGSSVKMRVETGADDKIREYMDTGITRTLDDRVELDSDLVFNKFVSQVISIDMMLGNNASKHGKATPEDAREFFEIHQKALRLVYDRHRREKGTGQVAVSLAAMEYFEKDPEKADEFYSDIFIAAGNVQQSQMLRDYLLRTVNALGGYSVRKEVYSKAVGCMKAHMESRHVAKVTRAGSW
jgi:hypothetical protein